MIQIYKYFQLLTQYTPITAKIIDPSHNAAPAAQ